MTQPLIIINTVVFLLVTFASGSLFSPSVETLVQFGAKETIHIVMGEWWRFVTPIFLHIGLLHFTLNNIALHYVGRYIEIMIGGKWLLFVYLLGGVAGNVASTFSNLEIGAGASGAIFSLVGVGVTFEWLFEGQIAWGEQRRRKLVPGPFTSMAILNIGIAVAFNFFASFSDSVNFGIDNAAHLGGLFTGMILGFAYLRIHPNRLMRVRPWLGWLLASTCILLVCAGIGYLGLSSYLPNLLVQRLGN